MVENEAVVAHGSQLGRLVSVAFGHFPRITNNMLLCI